MKALVKKSAAKGIWMEDVPLPKPGLNEVLIKVIKTAICGTDLHIYKWDEWSQKNIKVPRVIGHEFSGIITELGEAVQHFELGDRVTAEGHIVCGICRNCKRGITHLCANTIGIGIHRDGAFAEYISVPAANLVKLDAAISDDIAAIFDPFGNAVHAVLSFPMVGEDVLITGAGLIGNMAVAVCKAVGARNIVVTDVNDYRLEIAKKMGATRTINPQREKLDKVMNELSMTNGFDIGLEMSGSADAFNSMLKYMFHGGKVALLGLLPSSTQIDWDNVIFKGLQLKGIYGREMFETWYKMEQLIKGGIDISPIISHNYSIEEFQQGFEIMESGNCGKVILEW
ncbi:MAG: L-threonine 3-dehydrogenase [Candidatus Melainabacteria bacterium]|jgi:threonine 3-dehydrogenase|nr:L-threonine 3-dehydrogenase [Candidatus Melainabacteria bacterium]